MRNSRLYWLASLGSVVLMLGLGDPSLGQLPEKFENLEILPEDIERIELLGIMKSFTSALGVRCDHCHVGEDGKPLSEFDFASDEKKAKEIARVMMLMTIEINDTFLPRAHQPPELVSVHCVTCHRGQDRPRSLEQVLLSVVENEGIDAAIAHYRELRDQHYGSFTFDFSEETLARLSQTLVAKDYPAEAVAFLLLNTELYPEAGMSFFLLGELLTEAGNRQAALAAFQKAASLEPGNPLVKKKLQELEAVGEAAESESEP